MVHKKEKVDRVCVICGSEFQVHRSRLAVKNGGTCCSVNCSIESRAKTLSAASPVLACEYCRKCFHVKKSRISRGRPVRFCSHECSRQWLNDPETVEERFRKHINYDGPIMRVGLTRCHEWTGTKIRGYGLFCTGKASFRAHRFSWFLRFGKWPESNACHECDNPGCVNADHLFDGDHASNQADKVAKARQSIGEDHGMSKLTASDVHQIRGLLASGERHRDIASIFCVSKNAISSISSGRTWSHLNPDAP